MDRIIIKGERIMKKILSLIISAIMLIGAINIPVSATNDEITVYLNSRKIDFDQKPIIENGRTLVPMRAIFEAMGCEVVWHDNLKQIVVWKDGDVLMNLEIDRYYIDKHFGDELIDLDVPPQIVNGRTLVPLRAISETIGAAVDWDGTLRRVTITYNQSSGSYSGYQSGTETVTNAESTSVYQNSFKAEHFWPQYDMTMTVGETQDFILECDVDVPIEDIEFYSDDKSVAKIDKNGTITAVSAGIAAIQVRWGRFTFQMDLTVVENTSASKVNNDSASKKNSTSNDTYTDNDNNSSRKNNSSNGKVSDYVDGAFLYISVPAGKSIEIPNTSSGTLKIQMDGVYNAMERKSNGQINSQQYNSKDKKGSISISKESDAIVQNSGYSDLVVSIPAEYGSYYETSEKVYEIESVGYGESVKIEADNSQSDNIYFTSGEYDYIIYNEPKSNLLYTGLKGGTSRTIYLNETMIITAKTNMDVIYCPATMSCTSSGRNAFDEIDVGNGETVRVSATDTSKTVIYTDKSHSYDYVIYGTDGKVKSQKQGIISESVIVNKNCYIDFTNTSSSTVTIKVPSVYKSLG